jgi:hypothetical protein
VRYEDLVAQPEMQAMRVQKYLGLSGIVGIAKCPRNARDESVMGLPSSRYPGRDGGVNGWRRYEQGLAPLQILLAEQIKAYEAQGRAILLSRL